MNFFPDPVLPTEPDELRDPPQPPWLNPPEDVLPGVVPLELILARSQSTAVLLIGIRAFPTGLSMTLGVRVRGPLRRRDLHSEVFDGPYSHDMDAEWHAGRLKWGFELSDGRRVTNVDAPVWREHDEHGNDPSWYPDRPVLSGGGGGGGMHSVDRECWLWPLPPPGRLSVVCQWLDQDIEMAVHELDAQPFLDAAARAEPVWPSSE